MDQTIRPPRGTQPNPLYAGPPGNFFVQPDQSSYWQNGDAGDPRAARQAFAVACQYPELLIAAASVIDWTSASLWLNDACSTEAPEMMQTKDVIHDPVRCDDGYRHSVGWRDGEKLRAAIHLGPVAIGMNAEQFENLWFAHSPNFSHPGNDRCTPSLAQCSPEKLPVSLCGYGAIGWLAGRLAVSLPNGVDAAQPGFALFTWTSIAIIDAPSLRNITKAADRSNGTCRENDLS